MNTRTTALFILALVAATSVTGQDRTANGYAVNWTNTIDVKPDTLVNGRHRLPAFGFVVYEADVSAASAHWKSLCKASGGQVSGSGPAKTTGMAVAGFGGAALTVLTQVTKDKATGGTRMVVSFAATDSTAAEGNGEQAAREFAVRMNRSVVQRQIDEQQEVVDKLAGKVQGAQKDEAKAQKQAASASSDLERAKKQKSKLSSRQADLQSEQMKYQERYNRTKDPKDLKKLTNVQGDLVRVQKDMARQLKNESSAQATVNKRQGQVPDAQKDQQLRQGEKEKANTELEALKRKLEAIR